jgi:hypothetical protein
MTARLYKAENLCNLCESFVFFVVKKANHKERQESTRNTKVINKSTSKYYS